MSKKYIDPNGLTYFLSKIKVLLANKADKAHTHDNYVTNEELQNAAFSRLFPKTAVRSGGGEVTVAANTVTEVEQLWNDISITLGQPIEGYDNEWIFTIHQNDTDAYAVSLPDVEWSYGIAPTFAPGSITEVRLYRVCGTFYNPPDGILRGVWNV